MRYTCALLQGACVYIFVYSIKETDIYIKNN